MPEFLPMVVQFDDSASSTSSSPMQVKHSCNATNSSISTESPLTARWVGSHRSVKSCNQHGTSKKSKSSTFMLAMRFTKRSSRGDFRTDERSRNQNLESETQWQWQEVPYLVLGWRSKRKQPTPVFSSFIQ